ncbi:putative DNA binding domain-containing protein [Candidatus Pacearchaeota archaeon]|nr:putative DNA binding domain-containing protein [Candidatus Pacearchaeota archaeon]
MEKKDFDFILQEGEGLKIEFKEPFDKSIANEMTAFANSEGGRIFLGIDDKRNVRGVEITNRLKSQIQDIARNPILFDIFHRLRLIEKIGSGISRMKNMMKKRGLKINFEIGDFFRIVFFRGVKDTVKLLSKNEQKIIIEIEKNPRITSEELSNLLDINIRNTKKNIEKLKTKGLLKRIGSAKGGYWEVIRDGG